MVNHELITHQHVRLPLQNVILGIISKQHPSTKLLHFFIIVGKLFLWDCRRNQTKVARKTYKTRRKTNKNFLKRNGY